MSRTIEYLKGIEKCPVCKKVIRDKSVRGKGRHIEEHLGGRSKKMSRNKSIVEMQREQDERLHTEAKLKTNELTPVEAICDCSRCQAKRRRRMSVEEELPRKNNREGLE